MHLIAPFRLRRRQSKGEEEEEFFQVWLVWALQLVICQQGRWPTVVGSRVASVYLSPSLRVEQPPATFSTGDVSVTHFHRQPATSGQSSRNKSAQLAPEARNKQYDSIRPSRTGRKKPFIGWSLSPDVARKKWRRTTKFVAPLARDQTRQEFKLAREPYARAKFYIMPTGWCSMAPPVIGWSLRPVGSPDRNQGLS